MSCTKANDALNSCVGEEAVFPLIDAPYPALKKGCGSRPYLYGSSAKPAFLYSKSALRYRGLESKTLRIKSSHSPAKEAPHKKNAAAAHETMSFFTTPSRTVLKYTIRLSAL